MPQKKEREIVSRRARPAKAPLSREVIVATALALLEKDGIQGLSLRKVAAELDTGPASLYVYVENLAELYSLMLDRALSEVVLPKGKERSWQQRLIALLTSYFKVLSARPGLAQVAMTVIATERNSMRLLEALLGVLLEADVAEQKAAWGADLLTLYVTSVAAEQDNRRQFGELKGHVQRALAELPTAEFPLITKLQGALLSGDGPKRFRWALDVIIEGITRHG